MVGERPRRRIGAGRSRHRRRRGQLSRRVGRRSGWGRSGAGYTQTSLHELLLLDDDMGSVMDLKLAIPREDMANVLAERFRKSPERLYGEIMRVLMSSEPEDGDPGTPTAL